MGTSASWERVRGRGWTPFEWHHGDVGCEQWRLLQYPEGRIERTRWLPGEPSGAPGTSWVVSGQTGSCEASIFPRHPRTQPAFLSSFKFPRPTCSLGFSPHKCFVELHLHGNTLLCYPGKQAFRPLLFFKKAAFFLLKKCMFIVQN